MDKRPLDPLCGSRRALLVRGFGLALPWLAASPLRAVAGETPGALPYRFFGGSARGDDLNATVVVATGERRTYASCAAFDSQIGFRMEGDELPSRGLFRLTARYPEDGRRIGRFDGRADAGGLVGRFSAAGRNGRWNAREVLPSSAAMARLSGSWIDQGTLRPNRRMLLTLDADQGRASLVLLRRGLFFRLDGVWMADDEGGFWFLALRGDGRMAGLSPLDLDMRKLPLVLPYTRRGRVLRLLDPFGASAVMILRRQDDAG